MTGYDIVKVRYRTKNTSQQFTNVAYMERELAELLANSDIVENVEIIEPSNEDDDV